MGTAMFFWVQSFLSELHPLQGWRLAPTQEIGQSFQVDSSKILHPTFQTTSFIQQLQCRNLGNHCATGFLGDLLTQRHLWNFY